VVDDFAIREYYGAALAAAPFVRAAAQATAWDRGGMATGIDIFNSSATPEREAASADGWAEIGLFHVTDIRKVAKLQRRAFRPPLAYGLTTILLLWALPKVEIVVARDGERIIGCAIGDCTGGQSRVISLCVDPTARRQGIGRRLLRAVEARLPVGDVVLMVEEGNEAAKTLYREEGYGPVGVSQSYYGPGRNGIWMQKPRGGSTPKLRF
jgi:ribosomal-protein-alanine N-acetyltransferase